MMVSTATNQNHLPEKVETLKKQCARRLTRNNASRTDCCSTRSVLLAMKHLVAAFASLSVPSLWKTLVFRASNTSPKEKQKVYRVAVTKNKIQGYVILLAKHLQLEVARCAGAIVQMEH